MAAIKQQILKILTNRRILATLFIFIGLGLTIFFGLRAIRSYRQIQFIRSQGLDRGAASIEAIRPWMTIRYIGVAYAVPEEYIFAQLDIPFTKRNSQDTLRQLNRVYGSELSARGDDPVIVDKVATAILAYRENPVTTGLRDIRPWMTIRYIANSTGVPEDYLLDRLGLASEADFVVSPLDHLADQVKYQGGLRGLVEDIKEALGHYEEEK